MKKLFLALIFLFSICITGYTQFESVPLRLVQSDGTPHTGQAANITFRRSPFGAGNVISGLTVTESGTAGNYIITGFTTFEKAKLFISGVEQTWWGGTNGLYVGDLLTGLNLLYGRLGSSNTWIGATNQFEDVLFHGTGYFEDILTGQDFQMEPLSNLYLWVTPPAGNNLIWKNYADSIYGIKNWYYDGTKIRLLSSGYKWYGRTATTSPFELNSSHFQWANDKLNLLSSAVNVDSIKHNNVTVGKDSTWTVLGEPVSKWRFLSLKKGYWYNAYPVPDWMWVYRSFDESGTLVATEEFQVINNALKLHEKSFVKTVDSISISPLDTFSFPQAGQWQVTVSFEYEFEYVNPNNSGYDSLFLGLYWGDTYDDEFLLDRVTYKFPFNSGSPFGLRSRGQFVFNREVTTGTIGDTYYLAGLTSGICHSAGGSAKTWIRRTKVELLKVR